MHKSFTQQATFLDPIYYGYLAYENVALHIWSDKTELGTRDRSTIHATFAAMGGGRRNIGLQFDDTGLVQVFWDGVLRHSQVVLLGITANPKARFGSKGIAAVGDQSEPVYGTGMELLDFLSYTRSYYRSTNLPIGSVPRVEVTFFDGPQPSTKIEDKPDTGLQDVASFQQVDVGVVLTPLVFGSFTLPGATFCLPSGWRNVIANYGSHLVNGDPVVDRSHVILTDAVGTPSIYGSTDFGAGGAPQPFPVGDEFDPPAGQMDFVSIHEFSGFLTGLGGGAEPIVLQTDTVSGPDSGSVSGTRAIYNLPCADGTCCHSGTDPSVATTTIAAVDTATGMKFDAHAAAVDTQSGVMISTGVVDYKIGYDEDKDIVTTEITKDKVTKHYWVKSSGVRDGKNLYAIADGSGKFIGHMTAAEANAYKEKNPASGASIWFGWKHENLVEMSCSGISDAAWVGMHVANIIINFAMLKAGVAMLFAPTGITQIAGGVMATIAAASMTISIERLVNFVAKKMGKKAPFDEGVLNALEPIVGVLDSIVGIASAAKIAGELLEGFGKIVKWYKAGRAATALKGLRNEYEQAVKALADKVSCMRQAGQSSEQIARTLHAERRAIGVKYKELTPADELEKIYARNLKKYGDKLGPSIEYLRGKGKSWDDIIESASRPDGGDLK